MKWNWNWTTVWSCTTHCKIHLQQHFWLSCEGPIQYIQISKEVIMEKNYSDFYNFFFFIKTFWRRKTFRNDYNFKNKQSSGIESIFKVILWNFFSKCQDRKRVRFPLMILLCALRNVQMYVHDHSSNISYLLHQNVILAHAHTFTIKQSDGRHTHSNQHTVKRSRTMCIRA